MTATPKAPAMFAMHRHETQPQTFEEVLADEILPIPDYINNFGAPIEGPYEIPARWYTDPEIHKAEIEALWKRKWQLVCSLDHIPRKGDTHVYSVAGLSFLVVRVSEEVIKGYWNSCLHRGVPLRQGPGRVDRLQCPFHGFTWSLEGRNLMIPHPEEFPHIDQAKFSLPEVQVGLWQNFVFINPDPDAEPLEAYLGGLNSQFQQWPIASREVHLHVKKVFPANWKVVQEAFMESYHVLTTHPQFAAASGGDRCSVFSADGNVSRGVLANGYSSDYVSKTPSEESIFRSLTGWWDDEEVPEDRRLPPGMTARQAMAHGLREANRPLFGDRIDAATNCELFDVFYYTLFPNTHLFGMIFSSFFYRFLPYGEKGDKCTMEVILLRQVPEGQAHQTPPEPILLNEEQEFIEVKELGPFGAFISQDSSNMAGVMTGLRSSHTKYVQFSRKFESKIRHFYALYEKALDLSASDEVAALKTSAK
jgi:nitrite reductase/ring-hydroxylating ferredoxin subunit